MNPNEAIYGLLGIIFGTLSAFAVFRSRFVGIEKDVESIKADVRRIERACGENPARDRREREVVILLASIAKRLGAANRLTDIGHYVEDEAVSET